MSKLKNNVVGVTLGDPFGIGPEIVKKALCSSRLSRKSRFLLIGDKTIFSYYKIFSQPHVELFDVGHAYKGSLKIGAISKNAAAASLSYLKQGIDLIKRRQLCALVTAPVCKEGISQIIPSFSGHTEFLAEAFGVKNVGMMFVSPTIKTMIVTRHLPIQEVSKHIRRASVIETLKLAHESLKKYFSISSPKIAVCGLNPHAGEGGTIGKEEILQIIPAVKQAKKMGINVSGPFAADTIFIPTNLKRFDCIVAMYHDQGLVPVKTLAFNRLVNLTVGLPFVRTSPAHGTAFDIAGKNMADPSSMIEALNLAVRLSL